MSSSSGPRKLRIGGYVYTVKFGPRSVPGNEQGISYHPDLQGRYRIGVRYPFNTQAGRSTLFHEALHALSEVNTIGLSERQVLLLEAHLPALLHDNPNILPPKQR